MIGTTAKGVKLRDITNWDDLCGLPEKTDEIHEWIEKLIPRPAQMRPLALQVPSWDLSGIGRETTLLSKPSPVLMTGSGRDSGVFSGTDDDISTVASLSLTNRLRRYILRGRARFKNTIHELHRRYLIPEEEIEWPAGASVDVLAHLLRLFEEDEELLQISVTAVDKDCNDQNLTAPYPAISAADILHSPDSTLSGALLDAIFPTSALRVSRGVCAWG